jgi:predicted secreted protein
MAGAGNAAIIRIRTSSGIGTSSDDVDGANQFSLKKMRDELDTTDLKGGVDKTFILGLKGHEIPISGDYESADTPQGRLVTAFDDGSSVWAVCLWDGSAGIMIECKVPSFDIDVAHDGKVTFSAKLIATGAVATAA